MEGKEEDLRLGANKFNVRQLIGTAAYSQDKDYKEPPPTLLFEPAELSSWSFYQARIAEFVTTFLYLYITVLTVMGVSKSLSKCTLVGTWNSRRHLGFWWHNRCPCLLPASQFNRDKQRPCNFLLAFILKPLRESCHRNQMGTSSPF